MTSCPSDGTLGQLGVDITEGPRFEELERHIETCAACQCSLEELAHPEAGWQEPPVRTVPDRVGLPEIPGFAIEDELGRGSMGVVYRAWQARMARRVALKIILNVPVNGARVRDYWLREAHSAGRVRDPRVVQIHDVGEANGCLYLVLEYVPGGSLKDRLDGPLHPAAAASLAEEIALGVAAIHRAGLLHLDLKPSNILLESHPGTPWESSSPKVADFGIARDADDCRMTGTSMRGPWGTPTYMAPEQVEPDRQAVGPASDVYALGAILYELLTGRPPFRAASLAETMDQIRRQDPVPLRRLNPAIPRDLETICTTCLGKDPQRRYPTAEALSSDLRRWREGRPITARPISKPGRAWRWARRRPLTAALGAALATTSIVGVASLLILWRHAEGERRRAEYLRDVARANYDVASRSLSELCEFSYQTMQDPNTGWSYPLYVDRALEQARARHLELARKNALEPLGQEQLATVDLMLATVYRSRSKRQDKARALLRESIELREECITQGADRDKARAQQLKALNFLATLGFDLMSETDYRWWKANCTLLYRWLCGHPNVTGKLYGLSSMERQMADYLADSGHEERAREFLREKHGLFESLIQSHGDSPDLLLARALTRTALGEEDGVSIMSRLGRDGEAIPGSPRESMLVMALAELTARTCGLRTLGPVSRDQQRGVLDDSRQAQRSVHALAEQTSQLGLDQDAIPAVAWQMRGLITSAAAHLRAVGDHRGALRNARLFGALAAEFVRVCPDHAEPYLLVCEAHLQDSKNARKSGDRARVLRSLQLSLDAALKAQAVDLNSEDARRFVVERRQRLAAFAAEGK